MSDLTFAAYEHARHAEFVHQAILNAERVPRGSTMYELVYGLDRHELNALVLAALADQIEGSPLSGLAFRLLLSESEPVACCAAWIEGERFRASGALVAMQLHRQLGLERLRSRSSTVRLVSRCAPTRTPGTLQLETFFVASTYRGRGLTQQLIEQCVAEYTRLNPALPSAEIVYLLENTTAERAYYRAGFSGVPLQSPTDRDFSELTGSLGFAKCIRSLLEPHHP